jgi:hypothetical protein
VNFYLSSIQQGIQSAHLVHELFNKYSIGQFAHGIPEGSIILEEWSKNHKTMIVLNGGIDETLNELYQFMKNDDNQFPFTCFHEDPQSLHGIMTCVGIVLPEYIYDTAENIRSRKWLFVEQPNLKTGYTHVTRDVNAQYDIEGIANTGYVYTQFEVDLIERMNQCPLAR